MNVDQNEMNNEIKKKYKRIDLGRLEFKDYKYIPMKGLIIDPYQKAVLIRGDCFLNEKECQQLIDYLTLFIKGEYLSGF